MNIDLPPFSDQDVQYFMNPGTFIWTKPANCKLVMIYCCGGGGAGGPKNTMLNGGGAGLIIKQIFLAMMLPNTLYLSVGAGGDGTLGNNAAPSSVQASISLSTGYVYSSEGLAGDSSPQPSLHGEVMNGGSGDPVTLIGGFLGGITWYSDASTKFAPKIRSNEILKFYGGQSGAAATGQPGGPGCGGGGGSTAGGAGGSGFIIMVAIK